MKRYSLKAHNSSDIADLLHKIANDAESEADRQLISQLASILCNSELSKYQLSNVISNHRIQGFINKYENGIKESKD